MLDERERQPEVDCQTDYRKESSAAIQCSSSESSNTDSDPSSSTCGQVVKDVKPRDGSNVIAKPDNSNGGPPFRTGRWTPDEKILFLYGLRMFGKGRWKKMSVYLPQRSLVQIKSHAQKVLKRQQAGENIFRRLEDNYNEIDNLVVQAARQRDALRLAGINVNTPSTATKPSSKNLVKIAAAMKKKQRLHNAQTSAEASPAEVQQNISEQLINTATTIPEDQTSDSSVLAAAALCQLSSIGGTWDQRDRDSTMIERGNGKQAIV